jgi:hypothetical protein
LELQEAQVIGDFFLPADQQPPGSVEPRMSTFDFPTPGFTTTPWVGKKTGKNPTDRGKLGVKRSTLIDGRGVPLAVAQRRYIR